MSIVLSSSGRAMSAAPGIVALWRKLSVAAPGAGGLPPSGPVPSDVPGLTGWWDASAPASMAGTNGVPLTGWNELAGFISNRVAGGAPLNPYSFSGNGAVGIAAARLARYLGGCGKVTPGQGLMDPALDPDFGFQTANPGLASSEAWTFVLVWSRPNWRQGSGRDNAPVTILSAGTMPVLQIDGPTGSGRLILFPGNSQSVLPVILQRRHTHSILLRYAPGLGIDVWLDNTRIGTGLTSQLPSNAVSPLLLLHDGGLLGAAQSWFHEAASWPRALTESETGSILTYLNRWKRGVRRGVTVLVNGQSNAVNFALNDGAASLLAQGIAWGIGALAHNVVASTGAPHSYTMQSGHGLYTVANGNYPGSFLADPGDGSDPSTWSRGADGLALDQAIQNLSAEDRADICAIVWPWNETDSLRDYSERNTFAAAAKRLLSLVRQSIGQEGRTIPLIWWSAIPYGTSGGMLMHRQVVAELAADTTQSIMIGVAQTSDSNPRGASWDPVTGVSVGGDTPHRDSQDNRRFARIAAAAAIPAVVSSGVYDTLTGPAAGWPTGRGPRLVHAFRATDTILILTVQHDAGGDLIVPRQAANGIGFAVMDGGTPAAPGTVVSASACVAIDPTHLQITLSTPLRSPSVACRLYYPYGSVTIGRGNAVTDDYSTISKPGQWDMAADLGGAWNLDFPLAATLLPLVLSDTP